MISHIGDRDLLTVGTALYWAEGGKTDHFSFTNSDVEMIKMMIEFLERVLKVERNRFVLRLSVNEVYEGDVPKMIKHWSKELNISKASFRKTSIIKVHNKKKYGHRGKYNGILTLRITKSTDIKYLVLGLIKALKHAGVAQGLERTFHKRQVAGSIPAAGTN